MSKVKEWKFEQEEEQHERDYQQYLHDHGVNAMNTVDFGKYFDSMDAAIASLLPVFNGVKS